MAKPVRKKKKKRKTKIQLPTGGVVSYTIPDSPVEELSDTWYDGARESGVLSGGLGRLVDGEYGLDNYRLEMAPGRGTGWLAWMRDSFSDDYVELDFYFDDLLTFDAVHLYTNNYFKRDVQVFARADIWFIDAGPAGAAETTDESSTSSTAASASTTTTRIVDVELPSEPDVSYTYIPDTNLENARNVSIALHGKRGRSCRFRLYFAARWIMISEVTFDSWSPRAREVTTEEAAAATTLESASASTGVAEDRAQLGQDADLNLQTITAREEDQEYVEVLIGVLTAITLLLLLVFLVILWLSKRQKLQTSPTVFKNPFGFAISMKDFLLNLGLGRLLAAATAGRSHNNDHHQREEVVVGDDDEDDYDVDDAEDDNEKYDDEIETANIVNVGADRRLEDELSQESLTVEQQLNSPLVDGSSQYNRSTYAIVATSDGPAAFHELQQQQQQRNGPNKNELRSSKSFERGGLYGACNNYNNNNNNNGSNGSSSRSESGGANYASTSCNNTVAGSSRSCSPAHSVSHYSSSTSAKQQQQQQQQQYYRTLGHQHQHGQRHHGQTRFYGGVGGSTAALAQPIYQQQQQQHHAHHQMSSSDLECSSSSPTPMKRWHASAKVPPPSAAAAPPVVRWNIGPCQDQLFYAGKEVEPAVIPAQCLRTMEKLGSGPIGNRVRDFGPRRAAPVQIVVVLVVVLGRIAAAAAAAASADYELPEALHGSNTDQRQQRSSRNQPTTDDELLDLDDDRRRRRPSSSVLERQRLQRRRGDARDPSAGRPEGLESRPGPRRRLRVFAGPAAASGALDDPRVHGARRSRALPAVQRAADRRRRPEAQLQPQSHQPKLPAVHGRPDSLGDALPRVEAARAQGPGSAQLPAGPPLPGQSHRHRLLQRSLQARLLQLRRCSRWRSQADQVAGLGEHSARQVHVLEHRLVVRRHPLGDNEPRAREALSASVGSEGAAERRDHVLLPKPMMCPDNVYRIMRSCWRRDESRRPSFKKIYAFLKGVAADYRP
uniref:Serine-threonine/tyrosine-protein kinase catalytic domain-containing protein n=1 Tax=Trichogramma kaykai TaxID=54128 RepID=A0ABD2WJB8_9HYME